MPFCSIKAFDASFLSRFAGLDIKQRDFVLIGPQFTISPLMYSERSSQLSAAGLPRHSITRSSTCITCLIGSEQSTSIVKSLSVVIVQYVKRAQF